MRNWIPVLVVLCCSQFSSGQVATSRPSQPNHDAPLIEKSLIRGELAKAESLVTKALATDKDNDDLRFQLGTVQVLRAVERLMQSLYANGVADYRDMLPFLRTPMSVNPSPRTVSYEDVRQMIRVWIDDLMKADATLAPIRSAKTLLPLHPGLIRLDLDGDGTSDWNETMWSIFEKYSGFGITAKDADEFLICFDFSDVAWLRGYCHLLVGLSEVALAHDFHELFERTGHLLFGKIKTPHTCVESPNRLWGFGRTDITDLIAFIHLMNFPVAEPERLKSAHGHLKTVVKLSRETWDRIVKETDDDHEWIPSPTNGQHSVIAGLTMSHEQLKAWRSFLDHLDDLLDGKALLPHWRYPDDSGVNLRRVFLEPRPFDLVLWIQGTAATPYIEKGRVLNSGVWQQLDRAFQGGFLSFSLWFN
ncbi:MAG: hypothetical protein HZA51_16030 [Planctomycetes bacterium]|nr:hypothetical protein [Planctomycetota bacterium]